MIQVDVCLRDLKSLPFPPSSRHCQTPEQQNCSHYLDGLVGDCVTPNMHSGRFPAADRLCRQEVFHIPPHIRPERRKKEKINKTPAIVMKAVSPP